MFPHFYGLLYNFYYRNLNIYQIKGYYDLKIDIQLEILVNGKKKTKIKTTLIGVGAKIKIHQIEERHCLL